MVFLKFIFRDSNGGECKVSVNETTGLPLQDNCYMDPILTQNTDNVDIKSSLMFSPEIAHVSILKLAQGVRLENVTLKLTRDIQGYFCDYVNTKLHNPSAPNKQNAFCDGKSIMAVIRESPDFQHIQ